jgi:hypothetical protein
MMWRGFHFTVPHVDTASHVLICDDSFSISIKTRYFKFRSYTVKIFQSICRSLEVTGTRYIGGWGVRLLMITKLKLITLLTD